VNKDKNNKLLGTVMAIHNPVSPEFMKEYVQGMDFANFMAGDGKHTNSGKALRFASQYHNHAGLPNFLQFGEGSGLRLLLSQSSNMVEASLLRIINFIYQLYADFMNAVLPNNLAPTPRISTVFTVIIPVSIR
jgi:hypothetical protein